MCPFLSGFRCSSTNNPTRQQGTAYVMVSKAGACISTCRICLKLRLFACLLSFNDCLVISRTFCRLSLKQAVQHAKFMPDGNRHPSCRTSSSVFMLRTFDFPFLSSHLDWLILLTLTLNESKLSKLHNCK